MKKIFLWLAQTVFPRLDRTAAPRLDRTAAPRLDRTAAPRLSGMAAHWLARVISARLAGPRFPQLAVTVALSLIILNGLDAQTRTLPDTQTGALPDKDAYFREARPGSTPRLFAPGVISDAMSNRDMAISPSGKELFYTIQSPAGQLSVIIGCHWDGKGWTKPEVAPFSGKYSDLEPAFSYDGSVLFFASNRPVPTPGQSATDQHSGITGGSDNTQKTSDRPPVKDYDIWMVKKEGDKWGAPIWLDTVINSSKDEYYPSVAKNGNLYFTRDIIGGKGHEDIVISEWKDGRYQKPYSLPGAINTEHYEFNAFVDPDERFLLFSSFGRADDLGGGDLYLSYKDQKGEWMPAVHLDAPINSAAIDFCPYISPDGKYFFFTSEKMKSAPPFERPLNFAALKDLLLSPGNGMNDIYWVEWPDLLKKYTHDR